nr:MAG TPA: centromere-binding protein [Caudoviricetes sp.]
MTALEVGEAIRRAKCYMTPKEFSEFSGLSVAHISKLPIISFSERKYLIDAGAIMKLGEQGGHESVRDNVSST